MAFVKLLKAFPCWLLSLSGHSMEWDLWMSLTHIFYLKMDTWIPLITPLGAFWKTIPKITTNSTDLKQTWNSFKQIKVWTLTTIYITFRKEGDIFLLTYEQRSMQRGWVGKNPVLARIVTQHNTLFCIQSWHKPTEIVGFTSEMFLMKVSQKVYSQSSNCTCSAGEGSWDCAFVSIWPFCFEESVPVTQAVENNNKCHKTSPDYCIINSRKGTQRKMDELLFTAWFVSLAFLMCHVKLMCGGIEIGVWLQGDRCVVAGR